MQPSLRIALIEDHQPLRELFSEHLLAQGYPVFSASSAEELDEYFGKNHAQLLILDINLPGEDGLSIARRYRNAHPNINIIMLTVRAESKDRILGYESGADLYLPKPVSADELSAAVLAIKRRMMSVQGDLDAPRLDVLKRVLSNQLIRIDLSEIELALIKGLVEAPDRSLEYWQLLELIGKEANAKNRAALTTYIYRLNGKLSEIGIPDPAIKALWKFGYQFTGHIAIL